MRDILTINAGSSSIRFAVFAQSDTSARQLSGRIERIGLADSRLRIDGGIGENHVEYPVSAPDHETGADLMFDVLHEHRFGSFAAVGHRVVQGMQYTEPQLLTPAVTEALHRFSDCDPEHMPAALALVKAATARYPDTPQIACFDTAFHVHMPTVARLLPIPRHFSRQGVRRYGYHGLSYAFLMEELIRQAGEAQARGRVILAHLGNGASLAAVREGVGVDTSMGFTPAGGIVMGSRTGDLDPGVIRHLMVAEGLDSAALNRLINEESGLLGVSGRSADMRDLLAHENTDTQAAEAVALFCYQVRKQIGAYAAALGGVDTLVFSGGIGEHAAVVRERICAELGFLGIELDLQANERHDPVISVAGSGVAVRVIPTDEEQMIARYCCEFLRRDLPEQGGT